MKNALLFIFTIISISIYAQNQCISERYYSEVFSNTQSTTAIKFGEADPYGIINNQNLYLDIIEPVGDTLQKRPLILHQFGGGFLIGWRTEPVIPQMAEMYAKRGFVFATIDYRLGFNALSGESAERAVYRGTQDMNAALRFLVDNADLYGIDTSAIFITGTSAGCIAALSSTYMQDSDRSDIPSTYGILFEPDDLGCLNCEGNSNYNNQQVQVHGIINNWGAILDTSYINPALDPNDNVPVISFHGTNDAIVPYVEGPPFSLPIFPNVQGSFLIHQRLSNLGIKNKLVPLQGLGHEPQLLQLQTWVTDTIISQGSQFVYEIMYGDSIQISGDHQLCVNEITTYSLPLISSSQYCWEVNGGNIININNNEITIEWNSIGNFELIGYELDKREISKTAILNIEVQAPILPNIIFTSNDGLFNFSSTTLANSYTWNFGDSTTAQGNPIQHQYLDTGKFQVALRVESNFCLSTIDTFIQSDLCPEANVVINQNDSVFTFSDASNFNTQTTFIDFEGNVYNSNNFTYTFQNEGNYALTIIATNNFCSDTLTRNFTVEFCSSANFNFNATALEVEFYDSSSNAYFYTWNFGDGHTSAIENPTHTYDSAGIYLVSLISNSINGCADTIQKEITLTLDTISGIRQNSLQGISIYPNPFTNSIQIQGVDSKANYQYTLSSTDGKIIQKGRLNTSVISTKNLSAGVYFLHLQNEQQEFLNKVLIKE